MSDLFDDIQSRAVAVTAYLYAEELFLSKRTTQMAKLAGFYVKLLGEIKHNMERIAAYTSPTNQEVLEQFQKYVIQASVEPYSIRRRHEFVKRAFEYYLNPKTKGRIIGAK